MPMFDGMLDYLWSNREAIGLISSLITFGGVLFAILRIAWFEFSKTAQKGRRGLWKFAKWLSKHYYDCPKWLRELGRGIGDWLGLNKYLKRGRKKKAKAIREKQTNIN